ncbi:acid phosphatase 1 isoform X1 [Aristolochia californica]|uniref:acid phosphatase 1 isoform X1 n=1 Tax=Aristolochia californica TaxID=171875 RepID=UPI0035D8996C
MFALMRSVWEVFVLMFISVFSKTEAKHTSRLSLPIEDHCLSWRVGVEANNVRAWRSVPIQCLFYVEHYMLGGQYDRDVSMVVQQIYQYMADIVPGDDGKDAWILDVDDTCLSNLCYYQGKRYGVDPFDSIAFEKWAMKASCPAIPAVLGLFERLIDSGFKVFLLSGRDEEKLGIPTIENLENQGIVGYERIILRKSEYRGKGAVFFKSEMRKQLVAEGYRIRGNVGDQWSDLQGDSVGDRTFKLPNAMYFVP